MHESASAPLIRTRVVVIWEFVIYQPLAFLLGSLSDAVTPSPFECCWELDHVIAPCDAPRAAVLPPRCRLGKPFANPWGQSVMVFDVF